MKTMVKVQTIPGGLWQTAWLTDERSESSYGQPVVVVQGEDLARGSGEVHRLRVKPKLRLWAEQAGFQVE
jgi:hypothetical protein